jgi:hypothetical protein
MVTLLGREHEIYFELGLAMEFGRKIHNWAYNSGWVGNLVFNDNVEFFSSCKSCILSKRLCHFHDISVR